MLESASWGGGLPGQGGDVCLVGGCLPGLGGSGIPACTEADTLPPCGQTHTCKNITLATTLFAAGNKPRSHFILRMGWFLLCGGIFFLKLEYQSMNEILSEVKSHFVTLSLRLEKYTSSKLHSTFLNILIFYCPSTFVFSATLQNNKFPH